MGEEALCGDSFKGGAEITVGGGSKTDGGGSAEGGVGGAGAKEGGGICPGEGRGREG